MAIEPISAVISGIANIATAVTSLVSETDAAKRNAQLIEFQQALIQVQTSAYVAQVYNSSFLAHNQELEKEIVSLKDWSAEKQNYEILEVASGIFAYVARNNVQPLQSAHKFCTNCFDKGIKTILQQQRVEVGRQLSLTCNPCKQTLVFRHYSDQP
jgi:hypothetical protein